MKKIFFAILLFSFHFAIAQSTVKISPVFSHTTIYVVNLQQGSDFYKNVIGLDTIPEPFHDGRHTWFAMGEHNQLHVVSGAKQMVPHDVNIHLAFSVPSLEAFMKHLDDMHISYGNFQAQPKQIALRPDGVHQIYLQDPDGYWIEVNDDSY